MANGTNIAASKNRGCGTFNLHMDEFRGGKITISVQRDHRKARCEENVSSPINRSRNAKIPGPRRDTHSTEQQDNPTRMHDDLWTGSTSFRYATDIFSWKPTDMTGVSPHIAEHRLNVREGCSLVRQKKRSQAPERNKAIQEEVEKLRMGMDFKDLNKACPKDGYPLPNRLEGGIPLRIPLQMLSRCIQRITSNKNGQRGLIENSVHHKPRDILLFQNAFRLEECRSNLLVSGRQNISKANWQKFGVEAAFKQMKKLIAGLPTLTAPMEKEELIMYLVAAREAVSAVLMTEKEAKQMLVYFVSRALQGPEINYVSMEKLILALVYASKRLKRYFQAHPIIVITDQPIKQVLSKPEIAGRMQKWSIELGEYDIQYMPRTSVKGQILADFIVERPEDNSSVTTTEVEEELSDPWTLFTDGSSCVDGSGAGLILTNPKGTEFTYALRFRFDATNNEAVIAGLRIVEQMGVKNLQTNVDPCLVANQVPRSENKKADALSKIASTSFAHLTKQVLVEELNEKSINEAPLQANYVLREIHEGSCSMHAGTRSMVAKAIQTGYYWPTMHADARKMIKEFRDCQVHRPVPRNPQQKLTPIISPWPFYKWGIDIAGPFPEGPVKVKFLIVAIDYFTKWIEAKPVATITGNQIKKFVWDNIVCRFGLPGEIISDNGKQFRDNPFKDWCEKLCICQSKDWIEEIPHVLWAHRTMIKSSNGDTPFSLTYGTKTVIPAKIGMPTLRTAEIDMVQNDEALEINLDLLEERGEQEAIHEARSKAKMEKYYNSKVRNTSFKPGDLVYRNMMSAMQKIAESLALSGKDRTM
ncbi:reverse transcriptase domain-containing protein [Tanacetum coccineum]